MFYGKVQYDGNESPAAFADRVAEGIRSYKVLHITGVDPKSDLRTFYDELTEAVGECYYLAEDAKTNSRNGQKWFEIRFDPSLPNAYRHSHNAQPLHTDGSYIEDQPPVTLMYCVNRAPEGGETTFVDADDLLELLREHDPELLAELQEVEMLFEKVGDRKRRKVVDRDARGTLLNWNYYCVAPEQGERIDRLRERLFAFNNDVVARSEKVLPLPLDPGEAVAFQDERVLHGRNGFKAYEVSDRWLWKAFIAPHSLD